MKLNKATVALVLLLAAAAMPSSLAERRLKSPKSTKGTYSGNGIFFSSVHVPTASPTVSAAPSVTGATGEPTTFPSESPSHQPSHTNRTQAFEDNCVSDAERCKFYDKFQPDESAFSVAEMETTCSATHPAFDRELTTKDHKACVILGIEEIGFPTCYAASGTDCPACGVDISGAPPSSGGCYDGSAFSGVLLWGAHLKQSSCFKGCEMYRCLVADPTGNDECKNSLGRFGDCDDFIRQVNPTVDKWVCDAVCEVYGGTDEDACKAYLCT